MTSVLGLPRPLAFYEGDEFARRKEGLKPIPWIVDQFGDDIEWMTFDTERSWDAYARNLCQVCGERLWWCQVMLSSASPRMRESSGPPCHPRCAFLAVSHCPRFIAMPESRVLAWVYWGLDRAYVDPQWREGEGNDFTIEVRPKSETEPVNRRALRALALRRPHG